MNAEDKAKAVQEQAVASWITYLNQIRIDEFLDKLCSQNINLENALKELNDLKISIIEIIGTNRGGDKGIHGFIGERMQVSVENAKKLVDGLNREYHLVDDNGPIDYIKNGIPIQQKARQTNLGLNAIREHSEKYPDFLRKGGIYQIPKDYHERLKKLWNLSVEDAKKLDNRNGDYKLWKSIRKFEENTGITIDKIEPMNTDYSEIQKGTYEKTISEKENEIKKKDQANRTAAYEQSKPTWKEAGKAAKVGAGTEAAVSLCLAVVKKYKEGKRLSDYTSEDLKEIGLDTGKGAVKGGIRGGVIYGMTNFTCTPANVASAMVTATFGTIANAVKYAKGEITKEDFIINSEVCCMDAGVSAVSALLGEVLIPIPVVGAVIGTSVGNFVYGIAQQYCDENTKKCVKQYYEEIKELNAKLDEKYRCFVEQLEKEFNKFTTIMELAFDENVNVAFDNSILLAQISGVEEDKILKTKIDVDNFFLA